MSWLQSLSGKCVLVTGSTSGIGLAIATQFAKVGCRLMLHGIESESQVTALKQQIASLSKDKVAYSCADLTDPSQCAALIEKATKELGQVDVLVNNAGVQYACPVEAFPPEKWNWLMSINLTAPFLLTRAVIPQMYERKWGRLIHISSANGKAGSKNKTAYCASKHGLAGFAKSVALEAGGTGVTSNCICPGYVLTPLIEAQIDNLAKERGLEWNDAKLEFLLEKHPSKDFVRLEDLGALAVFLASDAASQTTGALYSMDGGWTAQ